ncbi:hypothetical protein [Litchfieldia alkalitelluris]|uniref:hypothetical protein n=1 Tax=Litchfieldia alkalitelluris TaxID=304268 RepID=UPI0009987602|nr:hypothetical protein [Litchfieldia alkalitelluris]
MSKRDKILGIAIGVLIIFNIVSYNKVSNLEERLYMLDSLSHEIDSMNHSVHNISSEVGMRMNEFMQEQLWIPEKNYEVLHVDIEGNTIDVQINWTLREQLQKENVSFLYRETTTDDWTELEATHKDGLNYSVEHTFPLKGNYETQVIASSESGTRSEDLLDLNFKEQLDTRIIINAHLNHNGNRDYDLHIDINNPLKSEFMVDSNREALKIQSAMAYLTINGKAIKEFNLLELSDNMKPDPDSEYLFYSDFITLDAVEGELGNNAKLHIVVEDGLGLQYEVITDAMN